MRLLRNFRTKLIAGIACVIVGVAMTFASVAGPLGTGSQSNLGIQVRINGLVRISKLNDINLGTWSGSGDLTGADNLCVFSTTWGYSMLVTSSNGSGTTLRLSDGTNHIAYQARWRDFFGNTVPLQNGQTTGFLWGVAFGTTCPVFGTNTRLSVTVPAANIGIKPAATYSDTLTFVLVPQ